MEQLSSAVSRMTLQNLTRYSQPAIEAALLPLVIDHSSAPSDFGWWGDAVMTSEDCQYHNAGTCPDCGTGMVRLGNCYSCPSCGWGSCGG